MAPAPNGKHAGRHGFSALARTLLVLPLALAPLIFAGDAVSAGLPLSGTWSAGPLNEVVTVTSWPDDCGGEKPKSGGAAGGSYRVTESGDELVFSGPQAFRTDQCWDSKSGRRVSHSATPATRFWRTRCESAPGTPFKATITTVVRATGDDTIILSETAKYEAPCLKAGVTWAADVDRTRTWKLVARDAPVASASATDTAPTTTTTATETKPTPTATTPPTKAPPPSVDCSAPGDPATLEVRPKRKLLRPGESFDVRARVADAKGCDVATKLTFRVDGTIRGLTVDAAGHVTTKADAEPAAGGITVEGGGKSARMDVEIVSDAKYADLLGKGGIDQSGADEGAVAVTISSGAVSGSGGTVPDAKATQSRKGAAVLSIAGGVLLLAAVGFLVLRRKREHEADRADAEVSAAEERKRQRKEAQAQARAAAEAAAKAAATKRAAAPAPAQKVQLPPARANIGKSTMIAVSAQDVLSAVNAAAAGGTAKPGARVCPKCHQALPDGAEFCPNDGTRVAATSAASPPVAAPAQSSSTAYVCPTCGQRYDNGARFCSKDGIPLVPAR